MLSPLISEESIKTHGFNDKLLFDCSFNDAPLEDKSALDDCNIFRPTLTNNGLCYSFNGLNPKKVWKDGQVVRSFEKMFSSTHLKEKFGRSGNKFRKEKRMG